MKKIRIKVILMNFIFSSTLFSSINTNQEIYSFVNMNKSEKESKVEDHVKVKTFSYDNQSDQLTYKSKKIDLLDYEYENLKEVSKSVFRLSISISHGTGFLIGDNLMLTNYHVMHDGRDQNQCRFMTNERNVHHKGLKIKCKELLKCNKQLDYCLVEIIEKKGSKIHLISIPKLELVPDLFETDLNQSLYAIGNSKGIDLFASKGRGVYVSKTKNKIRFYASVLPGNSGGPILNENFKVAGLVYAQSKDEVGDDLYSNSNFGQNIIGILDEIHDYL